jgi:hypothetical protein
MAVINDYFPDILNFAGMSVGMGAFRAYVKPKGKQKKAGGRGPFGKFRGRII